MRRRTAAGWTLLAAAATLVTLFATETGHHLVRAAAGRVTGLPALLERRWTRDREPPFAHLAASQVGYAPSMRKEFTSPAPFQSFVVRDERSGEVVLRGGGPARALDTDLVGATSRVFTGDFSALVREGRYRVVTDGGLLSHPFAVSGAVFDGPLRSLQRWFYYQRAFTDVSAPYAEGPWTHPSDAHLAPPGVRGGWHDAGDLSLYSAPLNAALFWLLLAFADFAPRSDDTDIPESGNGVPDLLDEARWGLAWLLSVQEASGGFRNTTCQDRYGPYGTNSPHTVPPYRNGEVGTLATGRAVGSLAFAASVFRPLDPAFADRCLAAARAGLGYLEAHAGENSDGPTCPSARRDGDREVGRQVRMFAAAGMLLATGEPRFLSMFEENYSPPAYDPGFLHLAGHAALLYLRAPAADSARKAALRLRLRANADQAVAEGRVHPFGWSGRYHWGSLGAALLRTGLFSAPMCIADPAGDAADCDQALSSVHYLFGRNGRQFCYVSGLSGVTRGMRHGFHQWLAALQAVPRDFPGMVAGGPCQSPEPTDRSMPFARPLPIWGYFGDPAFPRGVETPVEERYTDNDSWSTNEPSVEWEAESVYHLHLARWLAVRTSSGGL
ncbi:MAG TPA: glycoside hydrolase family 9 protein [Myxococcaceae bacterium]|nr:glycoside hydrolase family 9 protein [Myxococcaceae bacterium]